MKEENKKGREKEKWIEGKLKRRGKITPGFERRISLSLDQYLTIGPWFCRSFVSKKNLNSFFPHQGCHFWKKKKSA